MRLLGLFFCALPALAVGPISVGLKAGVPMNDAFAVATGGYRADTKRFTIGPEFDLNLPFRIGIEFDVLYKRLGYDFNPLDLLTSASTTANSWEFPLLLKWRVKGGLVRPYLEVGMNTNHLTGLKQARQFFLGGTRQTTTTDTPDELQNRTAVGGTVGGGLEVHLGPLKVSPEIRYTRWGTDTFLDAARGFLRFNRNQADFLVGFFF